MATVRQHGTKQEYAKPPATSVLAIVALFGGDSNQSRITGHFYVPFGQNTRSNLGDDKSKIELISALKCPLQQRKIAVLPLEVIRNHSKSGLLGSEFRLPFGELFGGDFAGLFRINLHEPSFERLGELGRLLR